MYIYIYIGLPWWLSGKESACQCRRHEFDSQAIKIPWIKKWQHTPKFLIGKPYGHRNLVGCSPRGSQRISYDLVTEQKQHIYVPCLLFPSLCQWIFRLLPCLGYCKCCCSEHWVHVISSNFVFLLVYAQEWDCWIIWKFCF